MLNEANDSEFVTRKWNIVSDNTKSSYAATNEVCYNIEILKSNLCNHNDAYILVTGEITVIEAPQTQVAFTNCTPFTKYITQIDEKAIDDVEHLDLLISVYNLIEYSSNHSEATVCLWFYSKYEGTNFNEDIANDDNFKCFKCKVKLLGNIVAQSRANAANGILRNVAVAVSLKYLSNFWRSLEIPLINCKVELKLRWTMYRVLSVAGTDNANGNNDNTDFFLITKPQNYMFL